MSEPSLAALAGHDPDAQMWLASLLERYRREGIAGVRETIHADLAFRQVAPAVADLEALVVEAVLTLSEARSPRITREAWAREEQRAEVEREQQGGGA